MIDLSHNSLADEQVDVGYEPNPDFSYYDNDNFVPSGSDGPHHNAMHSPSNHSPPSRDNSQPAHGTPPPVHLNQASDHNGTSGCVKWLYHPLINGRFFQPYICFITTYKLSGMPCDSNGNFIDPSTPPPPHRPNNDPNDWTPYESQLDFEIAEFL